MYRRNIQRGVAALAFVLVMSVAGAAPAAAAQRPGWLDRLAWSTVNIPGGQAFLTLLDRLSGRARLAARGGQEDQEKKGLGSDPNGLVVTLQVEDDPTSSTEGGH